jgi:FkbM family methyltransferase
MDPASKKGALKRFRNKRGLEIFHYNAVETEFVFQEVFENRIYFRHGIALAKGDCAWDIGANIGLFTMFLQENFEGISVHAFEPSLQIFEILQANTERYGARVVAHCCGIAGEEGEAKFTFYPTYSIMSGFHADDRQDGLALRVGTRNQWRERYPDEPELEDRFLDDMVASAIGQKQEYLCSLHTISHLIAKTGVAEIALLKIDAEASELDILRGIHDQHWPRIRQIVMEIHGGESVSAPIVKTLEAHGFRTVLEEEAGLSGSGLVNCYAMRPERDHQVEKY